MIKLLRIFTFKLGGKPFGIWLAWMGLAYAGGSFAEKLKVFKCVICVRELPFQEAVATWLVLLAAAIALLRRRLISCMFFSMSMTLLFFHSLFHSEPWGMLVAVLSVVALVANRRWFDEKLPKFD